MRVKIWLTNKIKRIESINEKQKIYGEMYIKNIEFEHLEIY